MEVLTAGTSVNYSGISTSSSKSSGDTLTAQDIKDTVKSIEISQKKYEEEMSKITSDPEWQRLYKEVLSVISFLHKNHPYSFKKFWIVYKVYYAMSPEYRVPTHPSIVEKYGKIVKWYRKSLTNNR